MTLQEFKATGLGKLVTSAESPSRAKEILFNAIVAAEEDDPVWGLYEIVQGSRPIDSLPILLENMFNEINRN